MTQYPVMYERLDRRLPAFIVIYCAMQPVLDAFGYWQLAISIGNYLTLAIRILLLSGSVILGVLLSDRKWDYGVLALILCALTAMHWLANLPDGKQNLLEDFANLIRIYLLPITTFCFITFLRRGGKRVFRAIKLGLSLDLAIILLVELLSLLTGTNRGTYAQIHVGLIGWFVWGNCQSAILSMLTPLVICWALQRWKDRVLPVALVSLIAELALYFFGTRLTFAALAASGLAVSFCLIIIDRRRWKQALSLLLIAGLLTVLYPQSPAAMRMRMLAETNGKNQQSIQDQLEELHGDPICADGEIQWDAMEAVYNRYCKTIVQQFGIRRVAEKYQYSLDATTLGDARRCKQNVCEMLMEDAPKLCRLFGLRVEKMFLPTATLNPESGKTEESLVSYEVENDLLGIYFSLGAVGLGLLVIFLLYFGLRVLWRLLRDGKKSFTLELVGFAGAYGFGLIHAYFTTSVLRRNNASVYLALVLGGLWYLTWKHPAKQTDSAV